MEQSEVKLVRGFGLSAGLAQALVNAGYKNPGLIKAASDEDLLEIPRFTQNIVDDIRAKVG